MKKLYIFLGIGAVGAVAYFKSKSAQAAASNLSPLTAPSNAPPLQTHTTTPTSTTPTKMVTVSSSQPSVSAQLAADKQAVQDQQDQAGWESLGGIGGTGQ